MPTSNWIHRVVLLLILALCVGGSSMLYGKIVAPRVLRLGVEGGALQITFDRIPDKAAVEGSLTVTPAVPGRVQWQGSVARFLPRSPLPDGRALQVHIGTLREDAQGPQSAFSGTLMTPAPTLYALAEGQLTRLSGELPSIVDVESMSIGSDVVVLQSKETLRIFRPSCNCIETLETPEDRWQIRQAVASPDGRHILIHQTRTVRTDALTTTRLWLYDMQTKTMKPFWYQQIIPDMLQPTPESSGVIIRESGRMTFVPFEVGKGEVTFLGVYDHLLAVTPDGQTLLFGSARGDTQDLTLLRPRQAPQTVQIPGVIVEHAVLSPDVASIYALVRAKNSDDGPSTRRYVVSYLLMNGVMETLTPDPLWSVTAMQLSRDGTRLALALAHPIEGDATARGEIHDLLTGTKTDAPLAASVQDLLWSYE